MDDPKVFQLATGPATTTNRKVQQEARPAGMPRFTGEHVWIVTLVHRVTDPERVRGGSIELDNETLMDIAGPGCLFCERVYSRSLRNKPCPGDGSSGLAGRGTP